MENKEILKKYIEQFDLKNTKYSFNESVLIEGGFLEWLYFEHGEYTYCISCSYDPKFPKNHKYIFSKIDAYGREFFLYDGFSEKKNLQVLKETINVI